jgi:hypothetical protein
MSLVQSTLLGQFNHVPNFIVNLYKTPAGRHAFNLLNAHVTPIIKRNMLRNFANAVSRSSNMTGLTPTGRFWLLLSRDAALFTQDDWLVISDALCINKKLPYSQVYRPGLITKLRMELEGGSLTSSAEHLWRDVKHEQPVHSSVFLTRLNQFMSAGLMRTIITPELNNALPAYLKDISHDK